MQSVPPTIWYRLVAGLNAQLRLVRLGHLKKTLLPIISWLETHANPFLSMHGIVVDIAWLQATTSGYCQLGLVVNAAEDGPEAAAVDVIARTEKTEPPFRLFYCQICNIHNHSHGFCRS